MLNKLISEQEFSPTLLGMFFNQCYIIRDIISKSIRSHAHHLEGVILDYGCGSKPYESFFKYSEYIGVDLESSGHPNDRKRADVFFDGIHLPFENEKFDGVLASEVFEHVFDIETCLSEIHRVLKTDGKILITCPFVWPLHEEPYDFARYTPHALDSILKKAGFRVMINEQKGTTIEALGQIFVYETLSKFIKILTPRPIKFLRSYTYFLASGMIFGICKMISRFTNSKQDFYLSNIVLAQKISN